MKLATTTGDFARYTTNQAEAVRYIREAGFLYLDYNFHLDYARGNGFFGDNPAAHLSNMKKAAEEAGVRFVQAHAPDCALRGERMEWGLLAPIRSIEACGMLGIRNMVIHSGFFPEFKYPQDAQEYFHANAPFMRALIPAMEKHEVSILFENTTFKHCRDGLYFPIHGQDLCDFVDFMDHPLFGAAWDVGHANMDGLDHEQEIMTMGSILRAIHVHDNDGGRDQHLAPFIGCTDYDALMRGLLRSGYGGYFTFESDSFFKCGKRAGQGGPLSQPTLEIKRAAVSMPGISWKFFRMS